MFMVYIYILTILWVVYSLFRKPIYFVHRKPYLTKNHRVYRYIYHNSNIFRYIYHKAYLTKKVANQPGDFFTIHFWLPLQSPCICQATTKPANHGRENVVTLTSGSAAHLRRPETHLDSKISLYIYIYICRMYMHQHLQEILRY